MEAEVNSDSKILVYGAGAIGCVVAARLILAGHNVRLLARGENYQHIKVHGIHLEDLTGQHHIYPVQVVSDQDDLSDQDYIFIATKFQALTEIMPNLKRMLHEKTQIIPLMNGIPFWYFYGITEQQPLATIRALDPHNTLTENFPLQHLIGAVVFITAQLQGLGQVKSTNPHLLIFGEPNHQMSDRLQDLVNLFENSGIEARPVENIRDQIWTKVIANLSSNPLSVVANTTLEQIYSNTYLSPISKSITQEVRSVAACYSARISIDPNTFMQLGAEMGSIYTSMWYDYQDKKTLELANIADAVFELAERYGCELPVTKIIYELSHFLSAQSIKNEGSST
nr:MULTISPECIES: 2-dehydropantoate 2-reductase [unclassified Acinetobacter]